MGPFELIDLIGLDVNLSVARSFYAQGDEPERWRPSPIQERLVGEGRLGRKSGQGFYDYGETPSSAAPPHRTARQRHSENAEATLDPAALAAIDPAAPAILPRLFAQIANEAAFALEEEVGSPQDMDTAMRLGFNWPRGPLELTELIGAKPRGHAARRAAAGARRGLPPRPEPPRRRRGVAVSAARKPASAQTAARNREAASTLPPWRLRGRPPRPRRRLRPGPGRRRGRPHGLGAGDLRLPRLRAAVNGQPEPLAAEPQLSRIAGLFELAPGFYQLRGFDLSNMHVVEGREGIVVIDPLVSAETAAAALALYREHRGNRPVTGLIYTHSHVDHFGGARGIVSEQEIEARRIPILAPAGFLHHAVSENVFAGTAMGRRAGYMYGALLGRGPDGQVGSGLGQTTSLGTITLIPPNLDIVETGQEETSTACG